MASRRASETCWANSSSRLSRVEQRLMMNAELSGRLAKRKTVRHEAEQAALGQIVERGRPAAADGASGYKIGARRIGNEFFAGLFSLMANYSARIRWFAGRR